MCTLGEGVWVERSFFRLDPLFQEMIGCGRCAKEGSLARSDLRGLCIKEVRLRRRVAEVKGIFMTIGVSLVAIL